MGGGTGPADACIQPGPGVISEVLTLDAERNGFSGAQIIADFEGSYTAELSWDGEVSGGGEVEFAEKRTRTEITLVLRYGGGDVIWYPRQTSGQYGELGRGAHLSLPFDAKIRTADGAL